MLQGFRRYRRSQILQLLAHAQLHLAGCLVGEGDGGDPLHANAACQASAIAFTSSVVFPVPAEASTKQPLMRAS